MRIKGSLFVDLPRSHQKPSVEKRSWQGHLKDFVQTQGQAQDRTRATRGHLKDKKRQTRTYEDKPRTDLGHAEVKMDLERAATEGKCNFTENLSDETLWIIYEQFIF